MPDFCSGKSGEVCNREEVLALHRRGAVGKEALVQPLPSRKQANSDNERNGDSSPTANALPGFRLILGRVRMEGPAPQGKVIPSNIVDFKQIAYRSQEVEDLTRLLIVSPGDVNRDLGIRLVEWENLYPLGEYRKYHQ